MNVPPKQPSAPISAEVFASAVRGVYRILIGLLVENATLMSVMAIASPDAVLAVPATREAIRKQWKPTLDSLEQATPESWSDILRKFEGPVQ